MGLRINTNVASLAAQRHMNQTTNNEADTLQRLSSGSRIIRSSDDAAGLAISEEINAKARSMGQAIRNAQDGASLIQVYEGGANEISNALMRMRELAMQASSDTVGDHDRILIDNEYGQLSQEVTRIAKTTSFNGRTLLDGSQVALDFQVGPMNDPDVDRIHFAPGSTDLTGSGLGIDGTSVANKDDAQSMLETIDSALSMVNDTRARVGASQTRLEITERSQGIFQENLLAAKSRIVDADMAAETANLTKEKILAQAGVAAMAQANEAPAVALQLLK